MVHMDAGVPVGMSVYREHPETTGDLVDSLLAQAGAAQAIVNDEEVTMKTRVASAGVNLGISAALLAVTNLFPEVKSELTDAEVEKMTSNVTEHRDVLDQIAVTGFISQMMTLPEEDIQDAVAETLQDITGDPTDTTEAGL